MSEGICEPGEHITVWHEDTGYFCRRCGEQPDPCEVEPPDPEAVGPADPDAIDLSDVLPAGVWPEATNLPRSHYW